MIRTLALMYCCAAAAVAWGIGGVRLDGYTLQPAQDGGLSGREYARNGITDLNAAIQEVKVAGEIDARGRAALDQLKTMEAHSLHERHDLAPSRPQV
jgi:hypothetical protein